MGAARQQLAWTPWTYPQLCPSFSWWALSASNWPGRHGPIHNSAPLSPGGRCPPATGLDTMDLSTTLPLFLCSPYVCCLTSQQHASVSHGPICSDKFTCLHAETEVADQTFYLTRLQYTDTGPTSPSTDPITLCAWQGSHWSAKLKSMV